MRSKTYLLVVVPVALVVLAVTSIVVLDLAKGGAATTDGYLGEAKAEKYPYQPPTPTPFGGAPTVRPRPTTAPGVVPPAGVEGDAASRDATRRTDLLVLLGAAEEYKQENGSYASTNGNVQTLCNYADLDVGCAYKDVLDPLPFDPLRDPVKNGYWYSSDGTTAKFYASLEEDIPEEQRCPTEDEELQKKEILICVEAR